MLLHLFSLNSLLVYIVHYSVGQNRKFVSYGRSRSTHGLSHFTWTWWTRLILYPMMSLVTAWWWWWRKITTFFPILTLGISFCINLLLLSLVIRTMFVACYFPMFSSMSASHTTKPGSPGTPM